MEKLLEGEGLTTEEEEDNKKNFIVNKQNKQYIKDEYDRKKEKFNKNVPRLILHFQDTYIVYMTSRVS